MAAKPTPKPPSKRITIPAKDYATLEACRVIVADEQRKDVTLQEALAAVLEGWLEQNRP